MGDEHIHSVHGDKDIQDQRIFYGDYDNHGDYILWIHGRKSDRHMGDAHIHDGRIRSEDNKDKMALLKLLAQPIFYERYGEDIHGVRIHDAYIHGNMDEHRLYSDRVGELHGHYSWNEKDLPQVLLSVYGDDGECIHICGIRVHGVRIHGTRDHNHVHGVHKFYDIHGRPKYRRPKQTGRSKIIKTLRNFIT